ncbi:MAG TPA: GMC family oxidoreductase [Candidatus Binatia bacterium]|nr:GMC family oxidoreductase [Candidatus Binatia bacterium]
MARRRRGDAVLGNRALRTFEFCIIGSGAGGASAAHVLTAAGKSVLVLEAGHNPFPGLDRARLRFPLHSNDELKYAVRRWLGQDPFLEPRVFRQSATRGDGSPDPGALDGDVNTLPKAVGGAFQHADCKVPRFNAVDFRLKSAMEALLAANPDLAVPGFGADAASASFVDWPFGYEQLEPFYAEAERLYGVQGATDDPYASPRSGPFPMPPGVPMYFALRLADGARRVVLGDQGPLVPHTYPAAITSRFFDGRPPCVDCGLCSGFGCPNNAKGSPAVTTLRRALRSGRCQLRYEAVVTRLVNDGGHVSAVEYVDGDGQIHMATASAFVLAASAIESARLCFLSGRSPTEPIGNRSGQVGRNLMCHFQTNVNGFLPERVHGQRGRAVTHGISDFRGVAPGGDAIRIVQDGSGRHVAMGGICEFSASQGLPITEDAGVYALDLPARFGARAGLPLKNAIRDLALGQHLFGLVMQAEDAPQPTNAVDVDPRYRDVYGLPVPRITYRNHAYELDARRFYIPYLCEVLRQAGAAPDRIFVAPSDGALGGPPTSRHVMGTLRMGNDPATSVVSGDRPGRKLGQLHDLDNLFAVDGSVFPTSSGYNPTLTIMAVALKIAHGIAGTAPSLG